VATRSVTPATQISSDHDTVVAEVFIAAPPARVFQAITAPTQTANWWGQKGFYDITEAHSDLRVGGKWKSSGIGDDGTRFSVEGEYLEVDPPRLLVHTWIPSYSGLRNTVVRWELTPRDVHGLHSRSPRRAGTGTLVTIRHSGFAGNLEQAQGDGQGWVRVLGWLQAFVERDETVAAQGPNGNR
jgi:uncharacterized protein YndB with AHSA1/START domain